MEKSKTPRKLKLFLGAAMSIAITDAASAALASAQTPEERVKSLVAALDDAQIAFVGAKQDDGESIFEKAFEKAFEKDVDVVAELTS